jgi:hypothetical protein
MRISHTNIETPNIGDQRLDPMIHGSLIKALNRQGEAVVQSDNSPVKKADNSEEAFYNAFIEKLKEIDKSFPEGTIPFISQAHPKLYHEINEVEVGLNITWKKGLAGKATITEFHDKLNQWRLLLLRAAILFAESRPSNLRGKS